MTLSSETTSTPVLELPPLKLGKLTVDTPVVLAPMAGVTNKAFRQLCQEYGGGLYVTEMVTARSLVERRPEALRIIDHAPGERIRSIQIYGVDAVNVGKAIRMVVEEDRADHIDLNFGCPAPKVTRLGGGSALPWKTDLFTAIVQTAVREASRNDIPLTIKMRKGIDEDHLTYLDSAKIARDAGVAAIALHGRTAAQHYSGRADWGSIARLRESIPDLPILGNGDIFSAEDAVAMVEQTGVDGVVIGRGCQGRPWLFGDLQKAFEGSEVRYRPTLSEVADMIYRHAELLVETFGDEIRGMREVRKHVAWYFKGYPVGGDLRARMAAVPDLATFRELLAQLDHSVGYPGEAVEGSRGRAGSPKKPHLPQGWLDSRLLGDAERLGLLDAELDISGG